jgi:hypothetical protein
MKIKQTQVLSALAISFGLLSLFSIWNVFNWDILGWGTQLFLFPFLALISYLAKLTPAKPAVFVRIQMGLLVLHTALYFLVFNFQDPHAPNLLALLVGFLFASVVLIFAKANAIEGQKKQEKAVLFQKQIKILLSLAAIFYLLMGVFAHPDFLLPGICLELAALILYFYHLIRP